MSENYDIWGDLVIEEEQPVSDTEEVQLAAVEVLNKVECNETLHKQDPELAMAILFLANQVYEAVGEIKRISSLPQQQAPEIKTEAEDVMENASRKGVVGTVLVVAGFVSLVIMAAMFVVAFVV